MRKPLRDIGGRGLGVGRSAPMPRPNSARQIKPMPVRTGVGDTPAVL